MAPVSGCVMPAHPLVRDDVWLALDTGAHQHDCSTPTSACTRTAASPRGDAPTRLRRAPPPRRSGRPYSHRPLGPSHAPGCDAFPGPAEERPGRSNKHTRAQQPVVSANYPDDEEQWLIHTGTGLCRAAIQLRILELKKLLPLTSGET
eukprot:1190954-Prorocentrum_minimum.AAC.2